MNTRTATRTIKCETNFGKIYVHVDFHPEGGIQSIAFSQPGKLDNTTIGTALNILANAINHEISEIEQDTIGLGAGPLLAGLVPQ